MSLRPISSKYRSRCKGCGGRISVGDRIYWEKGRGSYCNSCGAAKQSGYNRNSQTESSVRSESKPNVTQTLANPAGMKDFLVDWPDLKAFVLETLRAEVLPADYENQSYVLKGYCMRIDETFSGYSKGQLERWLTEGYTSPGLDFSEFNPPIREKRRLIFCEEGDEFHLDLAHNGEDNYMSEWTKQEVLPGIRINLQPKFQGDCPASVVNEYQAWTNAIIASLEAAGIDPEVNYIYQGKVQPSQTKHNTIIRLKKLNETTDFVSISPMVSPAAFRTLAFMALAMQGKEQGFKVGAGISGKIRDYDWDVSLSEDKGTITITNPYNVRSFPRDLMNQKFRDALAEIMKS